MCFHPSTRSNTYSICECVSRDFSQRLFVKKDGKGRVAATEILVNVPAVANLIRNEKVHQIQNVMQTSRALGMHTLEMSIQGLISAGKFR